MSPFKLPREMSHEDIIPLVNRVAGHLEKAEKRPANAAEALAHKLLHEMVGDVRDDFDAFVAKAPPADAAQRRMAYWAEQQFWQAMDPDVAQILRAVQATPREVQVLVMG